MLHLQNGNFPLPELYSEHLIASFISDYLFSLVFRPCSVSLWLLPEHLQRHFITAKPDCLLPFALVELDYLFWNQTYGVFVHLYHQFILFSIENYFLNSHFGWGVILVNKWKAVLNLQAAHRSSEQPLLSAGYTPCARWRTEIYMY